MKQGFIFFSIYADLRQSNNIAKDETL